jgi:hypothetical protein
MSNRERIVLVLEELPDDVPVSVRLRRVLKYCLRAQRLRCTQIDDGEVARLRQLVESLAARVAAQSELLTARAEKSTVSAPNAADGKPGVLQGKRSRRRF